MTSKTLVIVESPGKNKKNSRLSDKLHFFGAMLCVKIDAMQIPSRFSYFILFG